MGDDGFGDPAGGVVVVVVVVELVGPAVGPVLGPAAEGLGDEGLVAAVGVTGGRGRVVA